MKKRQGDEILQIFSGESPIGARESTQIKYKCTINTKYVIMDADVRDSETYPRVSSPSSTKNLQPHSSSSSSSSSSPSSFVRET